MVVVVEYLSPDPPTPHESPPPPFGHSVYSGLVFKSAGSDGLFSVSTAGLILISAPGVADLSGGTAQNRGADGCDRRIVLE